MVTVLAAAFGGLCGSALGVLIPWIREAQNQKKGAKYLAMRVAVMLEGFAIACLKLIAKNENSQTGDDNEGPCWNLPSLEEYPTDTDWKALNPDLAHRALSFRNDIVASENMINFRLKMENESLSDACNDETAKKGAQAWDLAVDLRKQYCLPSYSPGFDVGGELKKRIAAKAKRDAEAVLNSAIPDW